MSENHDTTLRQYQIVLEIGAEGDVEPGELEDTAEVVLDAVERELAFVALGPVVSVDLARAVIEIECTVAGETPQDAHNKMNRIHDVMVGAANMFEYRSGSTTRLEAALT